MWFLPNTFTETLQTGKLFLETVWSDQTYEICKLMLNHIALKHDMEKNFLMNIHLNIVEVITLSTMVMGWGGLKLYLLKS